MQRYFITEDNFKENIITGDDVFHIYKVMRNKPNDLIEICFNNKAYTAKIINVSSECVNYEIIEELITKTDDRPKITLIQGLAKGDKNDDIMDYENNIIEYFNKNPWRTKACE